MNKELVMLQYEVNLKLLLEKYPTAHINKISIAQGAYILGINQSSFRNSISEYGYINKITTLMKLTVMQCRETSRSIASKSWT